MIGKQLVISAIAVVTGVVALYPRETEAITAFSRKYGVACTACHVAGGNRLNREGIEFLHHGFRYAEGKGAKDKDAKGKGGDKSDIEIARLADYLSVNAKMRYNDGNDSRLNDNKIGEGTFEFHALALYGGGELTDKVSFFVEIYLHERQIGPESNTSPTAGPLTNNVGDGGRTKLAEAYLEYTSGGDHNFFGGRVGAIRPAIWTTLGAGARAAETRGYLVNSTSITTNEGIINGWTPKTINYGAEASVTLFGALHAVGGVVNGNGEKFTNVTDAKGDNEKDVFGVLEYTVADRYTVGLFAYKGILGANSSNYTSKAGETASMAQFQDRFKRSAITLNANPTDNLWIQGAYMVGQDKDNVPTKVDNSSLLVGATNYPTLATTTYTPVLFSRIAAGDYTKALTRAVVSRGYTAEVNYSLETAGISYIPFIRYDYFTHDSGSAATAVSIDPALGLGSSIKYFATKRTIIVQPRVGVAVALFGEQQGRIVFELGWDTQRVQTLDAATATYAGLPQETKTKDKNFRVELQYML